MSVSLNEDFALAENREDVLKTLVPETPDYYRLKLLQLINNNFDGKNHKEIEQLLEKIRYNYGALHAEMEHRFKLQQYDYSKDTQAAIDWIKSKSGAGFYHSQKIFVNYSFPRDLLLISLPKNINARARELPGGNTEAKYPSELDQNLIDFAKIVEKEKHDRYFYNKLANKQAMDIAARAIDYSKINKETLNQVLSSLETPDLEQVPELVAKMLDTKEYPSQSFGTALHLKMTLEQLEELRAKRPELIDNTTYIERVMTRLAPSDDLHLNTWEDFKFGDRKEAREYIGRIQAFTNKLSAAHNSYKVTAMYLELKMDAEEGIYNEDKFMKYLEIPKHSGYYDYTWRNNQKSDTYGNFRHLPAPLPYVNGADDEKLVEEYLSHFLATRDNFKPFNQFIRDDYLKVTQAKIKLLSGASGSEKWAANLDQYALNELKERVDIEFSSRNKLFYNSADPVELDVYVKNVSTLIVKIFEINTMSYYRENLSEINTKVNLDGLVPNEEMVFEYKDAPIVRSLRKITFPNLNRRGVFVIEFIGNGKSSRALIRKGQLSYLEKNTIAGHSFIVLDEHRKKVEGTSIWLKGHVFTQNKDGEILIPYTNSVCTEKVLLIHDEFTALSTFNHQREEYSFDASIYVDRESLIKGEKAQVIVRSQFFLNGLPASLDILEDVILSLASTDHESVQTTKDIRDYKLYADKDSTFEFKVPDNLRNIRFTLTCKVKAISNGEYQNFNVSKSFDLNQIDNTSELDDYFLQWSKNGYHFMALGKTGEPRVGRAIYVQFKHRHLSQIISVYLQTDKHGVVKLGPLKDIDYVQLSGRQWSIDEAAMTTVPRTIHAKVGRSVRIPYLGTETEVKRTEWALYEMRCGVQLRDCFKHMVLEDGMLAIKKLAAGNYQLYDKAHAYSIITIRVTEGEEVHGHILGNSRFLPIKNKKLLHISSIKEKDDVVTIKLENETKNTRVHVFATYFSPIYSAYQSFAGSVIEPSGESKFVRFPCLFVEGRALGDEYKYILERKRAKVHPGNNLRRPQLLLNPWAVKTTETGTQTAALGGEYAMARDVAAKELSAASRHRRANVASAAAANPGKSTLDFMSAPSTLLLNLKADKDGVINIKRDAFKNQPAMLTVVAIDLTSCVCRRHDLKQDANPKFKDLRLATRNALHPNEHYTEQNQITPIQSGTKFSIADITTSTFEFYDSLEKAFNLLVTLSDGSTQSTLKEFNFVLKWLELSEDQKKEKYNEYACHELHFFIYKKDRAFFDSIVKPYLANKKDKTFLDQYLLDEDLSSYVEPWKFSRLNVVEQILLYHKIASTSGSGTKDKPKKSKSSKSLTTSSIGDFAKNLYESLVSIIDESIQMEACFKAALKGKAFEAEDALGLEQAREKAYERKDDMRRVNAIAPAPPVMMQRAAAPMASMSFAPPPPGNMYMAEESVPYSKAKRAMDMDLDMMMMDEVAESSYGGMAYEKEKEEFADGDDDDEGGSDYLEDRKQQQQFYKVLDKTKEYAENNYYKLPISRQDNSLIPINAFWADFANYHGSGAFLSKNFVLAASNFTEVMFVVSVLDLTMSTGAKEDALNVAFEDTKMVLNTKKATIAFHKEIKECPVERMAVLVGQNYFDPSERYTYDRGVQVDKYVNWEKEEFLINKVYGCHIVLSNVSSAMQRVDLLMQIPVGAIPVNKGFVTKSAHRDMGSYSTITFEYYFYFPTAGGFDHFPIHVSKDEKVIAFAPAGKLRVVEKLTKVDTNTWDYISQQGSDDAVYKFLKTQNIHKVDLARIAWRMSNKSVFQKVIKILKKRLVFNPTLYAYSLLHKDAAIIPEYVQYCDSITNQIKGYFTSKLVKIDPIERHTYQHLEYFPLINARAHALGKKREILNTSFKAQYESFIQQLCYVPQLTDAQKMSVVVYLVLQDRIEEAINFFKRVHKPEKSVGSHSVLQYEYISSYLDCFNENPKTALEISKKHMNHPVKRWRDLFQAVAQVASEVTAEDVAAAPVKGPSTTAVAPALAVNVEGVKLIAAATGPAGGQLVVNFFDLDLELLFSNNPFIQTKPDQFLFIKPNKTLKVAVDPAQPETIVEIPKELQNKNLMLEVFAWGLRRSTAYYSNALAVHVMENIGQLKVLRKDQNKPLSKVYVKVYSQSRGGSVDFYKDGYTDLKGRFDYTSLSTNQLDSVEKFSILVMSNEFGAIIRDANPPKV